MRTQSFRWRLDNALQRLKEGDKSELIKMVPEVTGVKERYLFRYRLARNRKGIGEDAVPPLLPLILKDSRLDSDIREALKAIGVVALKTLIEALRDAKQPNKALAEAVAEVAAQDKTTATKDLMSEWQQSGDDLARRKAAQVAAAMGSRRT